MTALEHPDVLEGVAGPGGTLITTAGHRRLEGVCVAAAPDGRYDVIMRLRTRLVPLHQLACDLRGRISVAAADDSLAGRPRSVEIQIVDVGGSR